MSYAVFVVGIALSAVCSGYVMGVSSPSKRSVVWAMRLFLLGAVLMVAYIVTWVAGAV